MIRVRYYASGSDVSEYELYIEKYNNDEPIYFLDNVQDKIKKGLPIFNYANFFKDGLALDDESIELGDETDYYGWLIFDESAELWVEFNGNTKPGIFDNGIDIIFNKYTCRQIDVYIQAENDELVNVGGAYNENGLPEKVHLILGNEDYPDIFETNWADLKIVLSSPTVDGDPINIRGIYFGNAIDIENIFDFDMISESNPISDDLAINEMNLTAYIEEDFISKEGQKVEIYDNGELYETDVLKSAKEQDLDIYEIKTRSNLMKADKISLQLFQKEIELISDEDSNDWSWDNLFTVEEIINKVNDALGVEIVLDKAVLDQKISPFVFGNESVNARKFLQQLAWATCCRIDTTNVDSIKLFSYQEQELIEPDIIIKNEDGRILTSNIDVGESYSKILWKIPTYTRSNQYVKIGETDLIWNETSEKYEGIFVSEKPFYAYQSGHSISYTMLSPYSVRISSSPDSGKAGETETVSIKGYVYEKNEMVIEIDTGIKNSGTLEISKHPLYLQNFIEAKSNQLQKWYSKNNTLTATVVDNESEIRLGKILKIQLKKDNYFQGIITKVVRNNIGDYHTVDLEAHEWA